jgi:hypothetical protein
LCSCSPPGSHTKAVTFTCADHPHGCEGFGGCSKLRIASCTGTHTVRNAWIEGLNIQPCAAESLQSAVHVQVLCT